MNIFQLQFHDFISLAHWKSHYAYHEVPMWNISNYTWTERLFYENKAARFLSQHNVPLIPSHRNQILHFASFNFTPVIQSNVRSGYHISFLNFASFKSLSAPTRKSWIIVDISNFLLSVYTENLISSFLRIQGFVARLSTSYKYIFLSILCVDKESNM